MSSQSIPVFCINLARSLERRAHMEREFDRVGWTASFVQAIDGPRQLDLERMIACGVVGTDNQGLTGPLSEQEVGCYLSHERAWRAIRRSGAGLAIVCEDDVSFREPALDLGALGRTWPADCDILYLHYLNGSIAAPPFHPLNSRPVGMVGGYAIHAAWSCGGSQCYCLSARGAAKALTWARPIRFPVDGLLGRLSYVQELKVYALDPMPTESGALPSTISPGL